MLPCLAVSGPAAQAAPPSYWAIHCSTPEAARADLEEAAYLRVSGEFSHQPLALEIQTANGGEGACDSESPYSDYCEADSGCWPLSILSKDLDTRQN